jgi:L-iditol 2-dehydrogenase
MKATCYYCRTGRYNACPDVVFFSTPPYHGTLTRYHVHPEDWLHPLPEDLSFEEGSLLEPLSVALAGIDRSELRLGDPIIICGAGPIGLVTLLAAHAAGANPIAIIDLDSNRLEMAKKLIPRVRTVQVDLKTAPKDVATQVRKALGQEAKLAFECTGVESSVQSAIYVSASQPPPTPEIRMLICSSPADLEEWSLSSDVEKTSRLFLLHTCLHERSTYASNIATETHTQRQ